MSGLHPARLRLGLTATLVAVAAAACAQPAAVSWPPQVGTGQLERISDPANARPPRDGAPVDQVAFSFVFDMAYDRQRDRLLIAQGGLSGPAAVLAVNPQGRIQVLVDERTRLPQLAFGYRSERLSEPREVAVGPDGTVYYSEEINVSAVRAIGPDGQVRNVAGTGERAVDLGGNAPLETALDIPTGLAVGDDGTLYIADSPREELYGRLWALSPDGTTLTQLFGERGTLGQGIVDSPQIAADGRWLWIVGRDRVVRRLNLDSGALHDTSLQGLQEVEHSYVPAPDGLFAIADGDVVALRADRPAQRLATAAQLGNPRVGATALAFDGERLYVASEHLWVLRPPGPAGHSSQSPAS